MEDKDLIYSYTRKQAIEDGVLVEVSKELAKEAGFKVPVALTEKLYDDDGKPVITIMLDSED